MRWPWQTVETRSAQTSFIALASLPGAGWGGQDSGALMRDGYAGNAIAYRCVRMIAEAAASIPLTTNDEDAGALLARPSPDEAGRVLGFPGWYRFLFIVIPGIRPALVSAALLCFAHTLGEFGVVLMIGGNIPGETRVLSVALFEHVEQMNYQAANRLALTMMAIAVATVLLSQWSGRRHDRF